MNINTINKWKREEFEKTFPIPKDSGIEWSDTHNKYRSDDCEWKSHAACLTDIFTGWRASSGSYCTNNFQNKIDSQDRLLDEAVENINMLSNTMETVKCAMKKAKVDLRVADDFIKKCEARNNNE